MKIDDEEVLEVMLNQLLSELLFFINPSESKERLKERVKEFQIYFEIDPTKREKYWEDIEKRYEEDKL